MVQVESLFRLFCFYSFHLLLVSERPTTPHRSVFCHASTREILIHMRNSHRQMLIPSSLSGSSSTTITTTTTTSATHSTVTVAAIAITSAANAAPQFQGVISDSLSTHSILDGELSSETERPVPPNATGRSSVDSNASADKRSSTGMTVSNTGAVDSSAGFRSVDGQAPLCLLPGVDFSCGFKCSECAQVFDSRDTFARHFRVCTKV